jgi:hypothetical protein
MEDDDQQGRSGIRARSEEAIAELAQTLLENPIFSQALGTALGAGEKAVQAQRQALGAIDVARAGDMDRLTKRIRALSERIEALEDATDEIREALASRAEEQSKAKAED